MFKFLTVLQSVFRYDSEPSVNTSNTPNNPPMEFGKKQEIEFVEKYGPDVYYHKSQQTSWKSWSTSADMNELQDQARKEVVAESERIHDLLLKTYANETNFDGRKMVALWNNTFPFTALKTWQIFDEDNSTYVTTGDIGQMWLRDSSVQMMTYLPLMARQQPHSALRQVFKSVLARQTRFIKTDPYASAFFREHGEGQGPNRERCAPAASCPDCQCDVCRPVCGKYTYQHDFELDSLCFPLWLNYKYWKMTGETSHFTSEFFDVWENYILPLFQVEMFHNSKSKYVYKDIPHPFKDGIGLVWSFARPSDDQTIYGYNIPQNMMVVVVLKQFAEIVQKIAQRDDLAKFCVQMARDIDEAIQAYGVVDGPLETGGRVYAFEVDGYGNFTREDDANMPNLLWMPYLGYTPEMRVDLWDHNNWNVPQRKLEFMTLPEMTQNLYDSTRKFVLSEANHNYFTGHWSGLGSQHHSFGLRYITPGPQCEDECIWHLGIIMQGWTTNNQTVRNEMMNILLQTNNDQNLLHEGFTPNNPVEYNRDWFGWADGLFSLWVMNVWLPNEENLEHLDHVTWGATQR